MQSKVVRGFFTIERTWTAQGVVFGLASVLLFVYSYRLHSHVSTAYATARAFGFVMRWLQVPFIQLPVCRSLYTSLYRWRLTKRFGLHRRLIDHRIFAALLIMEAVGHTLAHVAAGSDLGSYTARSGYSMLMFLGVPLAISFTIYRDKAMHLIAAGLFYVVYATHASDNRLLPFAVFNLVVCFIDQMLVLNAHDTTAIVQKIEGSDFYWLEVRRPMQWNVHSPSQYALISVPGVGRDHPFTIVHANEAFMRFLIKRTGPWTNAVSKISGRFDCSISGPYGRQPKKDEVDSPSIICTASGMAIALAYLYAGYPIKEILCVVRNRADLDDLKSWCTSRNVPLDFRITTRQKRPSIRYVGKFIAKSNQVLVCTNATFTRKIVEQCCKHQVKFIVEAA